LLELWRIDRHCRISDGRVLRRHGRAINVGEEICRVGGLLYRNRDVGVRRDDGVRNREDRRGV
jgi:hypothetical protein